MSSNANFAQCYNTTWGTVALTTWGDVANKIWGHVAVFKTNWLPTDTYDVKVDFVRIFQNAVRITNVAQTCIDLWDSTALATWTESMSSVLGDSPSTTPKLFWEYSDMIKKEYFTTLISAINYTSWRIFGNTKRLIPVAGIKFNAALLNKIEILERDLNDEIHRKQSI